MARWSALQVLVTDPKELEKIRERESDITKGATTAHQPRPATGSLLVAILPAAAASA